MAKLRKNQEMFVIVAAIVIIAASVISTLWVAGLLFGDGDEEGKGYRNITFTDAVLSCQKQSRGAFGSKLIQLTLDDHSSRFDQPTNLYKIFYRAQLSDSENDSGQSDHYVNCFVNAEKGRVSYFESMEEKSLKTEAIRKDNGGIFGWPLKK